MISHCANPECGEPFVYLRTGRLFAVPRPTVSSTRATVEYFWLCGRCSKVIQPDFSNPGLRCTLVTRRARGNSLRS